MTHADAVYQMCDRLFTDYPLAIDASSSNSNSNSMILVMGNGNEAKFFILSHNHEDNNPVYLLRPWRARGVVDIASDDSADVPDIAVNAITQGTPIPRHGSLLGWRYADTITALVATYTEYEPESPDPSWAVMPRTGLPETQWPPFTGEHTLGRWFWTYYNAGSIVSLDTLIATTPETVFWAATKAAYSWDCCIIADDIRSGQGYTLNRGCYIYYRALQEDTPVPALEILLERHRKTDLAPRFDFAHYGR
jgi:hypothetical protein